MDLSIIIPAYNEANKIAADVKAADKFLRESDLDGEIIVVDDGSQDETAATANAVKLNPENCLSVITCSPHRGKGYAVRKGMEKATGRFTMFADSGMCVPYSNALSGLNMIKKEECDIAHGSRKLPESILEKPWTRHRRLYSGIFGWISTRVMNIPGYLTDTQCGFKVYRGDVARNLYQECRSDGFLFDIEVILRAQKIGYKIKEFPVTWRADPDSRLSLLRNLPSLVREGLKIIWNLSRK